MLSNFEREFNRTGVYGLTILFLYNLNICNQIFICGLNSGKNLTSFQHEFHPLLRPNFSYDIWLIIITGNTNIILNYPNNLGKNDGFTDDTCTFEQFIKFLNFNTIGINT